MLSINFWGISFSNEKVVLTNGTGTSTYIYAKKINLDSDLTLYTKIDLKWFI